jgi:hypothetical protein
MYSSIRIGLLLLTASIRVGVEINVGIRFDSSLVLNHDHQHSFAGKSCHGRIQETKHPQDSHEGTAMKLNVLLSLALMSSIVGAKSAYCDAQPQKGSTARRAD